MIWNSVPAMTIIDLVIIGMVLVSLAVLHKNRQTVRQLGIISSVGVIHFALLLIGSFYLLDILIMHVLPLITSHDHAMQSMEELHLNWSWVVFLIAISVIASGLTHLIRSVVPKIVTANSERKHAEVELVKAHAQLEVRVKERTQALQAKIIEHEQAVEALQESEERFRNLIEGSIQGIIIQRLEATVR